MIGLQGRPKYLKFSWITSCFFAMNTYDAAQKAIDSLSNNEESELEDND